MADCSHRCRRAGKKTELSPDGSENTRSGTAAVALDASARTNSNGDRCVRIIARQR